MKMKIGGISVNPKEFFDAWKEQMSNIISEKAKQLVAEKGSEKMLAIQGILSDMEGVVSYWEKGINWEVENPLI